MKDSKIFILKKNGHKEHFNKESLINAVNESAKRCGTRLTTKQEGELISSVYGELLKRAKRGITVTPTSDIHEIVLSNLGAISESIYREYMSYRDYKTRFFKKMDEMLKDSNSILYGVDRENANKNSRLISTKKELIAGMWSENVMLEYHVAKELKKAHEEGWLYEHDLRDRLFGGINCNLFDFGNLLKNSFLLNGVEYEELNSVEAFMGVLGDVILQASSQQYGGFTIPEIDVVGAPYVREALVQSEAYYRKVLARKIALGYVTDEDIDELAFGYVWRALRRGFRAIETRLNTINNCNGQTAFVTITFGLDVTEEGRLITKALLQNRERGIGKNKITPVFPKLVFLHRNGINGQAGDINYDLYELAIDVMLKRMYPDMLSLDEGYLGEIFDKYGLAISPMGCRAYLSPWYKRGGMYPAVENDEPVFIGRANCGAITLNTVRYAIESKGDEAKYIELLDKYFDIALEEHLRTYKQMCKMTGSCNPLFFCEGGCHVKIGYDESIERAIRTFTWSFGYIGLEEATLLMRGCGVHEDPSFAIKVLSHLNMRIEEAKDKHGLLFALYGTPAEGLAYKFRNKDFAKYGAIEGVTDKEYYMNSFHVNVKTKLAWKDKQDIEDPLFHLSNGGHIVYNEFGTIKNYDAIKEAIDYAMLHGKYYGLNLELDKCLDCGHEGEFAGFVCPKCGSVNILAIARVCGYLSYRKIDGDTRFNKGKEQETGDRVDHTNIELLDTANNSYDPEALMNLVSIQDWDLANGEGWNVSVWVSGCPHKCKGCHNKEYWTPEVGVAYRDEEWQTIIEALQDNAIHQKNLSILGGEPLAPYNIRGVYNLVTMAKDLIPNLKIYLWTGFTMNQLRDIPLAMEILNYVDVLVDGKFEEDKKEPELKLRGSSNQIIYRLNK